MQRFLQLYSLIFVEIIATQGDKFCFTHSLKSLVCRCGSFDTLFIAQRVDKFVACRWNLIIRIFRRSNLMSMEPDLRAYKKNYKKDWFWR